MLKVEPNLAKDRTDSDDPTKALSATEIRHVEDIRKVPNILKFEAIRATLLRLSADPRLAYSMVLCLGPPLYPSELNERSESPDPTDTDSIIDKFVFAFEMSVFPQTEQYDPLFESPRKLKVEPSFANCKMLRSPPLQPILLTEKFDAKWT
jgi:hypothetical protein